MRRGGCLAVATAACLVLLAGCAPPHASITVDPSEVFQVISGWEVTAGGGPDPTPALLDLAIDQVGLNRLRVEVRSGAENTGRSWSRMRAGEITPGEWRPLRYATTNDNDDPATINPAGFDFSELDRTIETTVRPLDERLRARGERLFVNLCYVAFTSQITSGEYIHDRSDEYAEFVLATYLHLRSRHGLVPDAWEVLLEPDNGTGWSGTMVGEAMVAAAARLREHGFEPRFIAPSVSEMTRAARYIDDMARVPGAMDLVAELSYHRYGRPAARQLRAITSRAARYGKPTSMLELWFGQGTYRVLHEDLTVGQNSAWQGRVLNALARPGPDGVLAIADDTRMNLQYFRHVRAGATRIGAATSAPGWFDPAAFVNTDGRQVVVVKTRAAGAFTITGLKPGRYTFSHATEEQSVVDARPYEVTAAGGVTLTMPGRGVATLSAVRPAD